MTRFKQTHAMPTNTWYVEPSRSWHFMALAFACICGAILLILIALLRSSGQGPILMDAAVQSFMVDTLRSDGLTPIMMQITDLALPFALVVCVIALTIFTSPLVGLVAAINIGGVELFNLLFKHLVSRDRPPEATRLVVETTSSFPSGHAVCAVVFYGFLIWLAWHYQRDRTWRAIQIAALVLVILAVGISRLYLGVHYCSDVIAGYCVGIIWLVAFTRLVAPPLLDLAAGDLVRKR